jgi:ribose transport system substrate-binding protein
MHYAVKFAAAMTAGLLLGTTAMAPAYAQDKPTLAFVVNIAADFWKAAEAGMKKAQGELPDYQLVFKYPDQSTVAIQDGILNDLVTAGVKGIMVSAIDPNATDFLNKIAGETAFFTTDSDASQSKRIAYVGSSNESLGEQAGQIAKEAMPKGGKCMGFVGHLEAANFTERRDGFNKGVAGANITLVDTRSDGGDQTAAKKNVEDVLVANPDITCMVGFYSYSTPAIYQALKNADKLGKITVIAFDDDPITLGGVKEGSVAGTVVQQPFEWAYQGFKLMAAYLKGDKSGIPAGGQIIVPGKILHAADVDAYAANLKALAGK